MKVLLVDDDIYSLRSMVDHLRDVGIEVDCAVDLPYAYSALRTTAYDALLVDCVLATGRDSLVSHRAGSDLIQKIRASAPDVGSINAGTNIIVFTAVCDSEILSELASADVRSVMQKPISTTELIEELEKSAKDKNG